jgi:2-keto-4-pentenoate hydratase/2-oxohepta-3-ene-1,7-dioic acid hydratase in catechol pathway
VRLVSFTHQGALRWGRLEGEEVVDLADAALPKSVLALLEAGDAALAAARAATGPRLPLASVRLHAPVLRPPKILGIGLNYADHAKESGAPIPTEPIVFMKATNTLVGPNDDVLIPRDSTKTDWEVELGIVIGSTCRYLESDEAALAAVAGYLVSHDVSEREFQLERGGQWDKGKSCETFNPAGPWLVTADAVPDPGALDLWLDVNGERRQAGNTRTLIFGVAEVIRYLSRFMVLEPGDIINTGTPPGVALGRPDKPYLRPGDVVELGIEGLGTQRQRFVAAT